MDTLGSLVRKLETNYTSGTPTKLGKYVDFSMYENVEKITAYLNSKHISGEVDALGREKPFFNIVTAAVNVWYRATDIDRKNILLRSTKRTNVIPTFLANIKLQEWMKKDNFGQFLNEWGRYLAQYGSAVVKFIEKDGELHRNVVPWNRLIVDVVDFDNNVVIEKLYLTPAQLRKNKAYDQEQVEQLIANSQVARKTLDRQNIDNLNDYIELYEVHGEMPLSWITEDEEDANTYVQQMHVVSFTTTAKRGKNEYQDFSLYKGKEAKSPYMITHLIKEDGRTQSIGAVEYLFDSQWMTNHTAKAIKDQLDLASKLIFQTADKDFVGANVLEAIETGDILIHNGSPLTQIQNNSHDISSLQSYQNQWISNAQSLTSTPDAITGNTMPSGTAYRQVAVLNQEAHSLFEIMTENKAFYLEEMMRKYVLPYIKKQLKNTDEIASTLDEHYIKQIDAMYLPNEAMRRVNERVINSVLEGMVVTPEQQATMLQEETSNLQAQLKEMGSQRFIKPSEVKDETWADLFKNFEFEVEVEVTNEQRDKEAVLTTLTTVLQTLATNPMVLQDPNMKMLFNKIIANTGVMSEIELSQENKQTPMPEQVANGGV